MDLRLGRTGAETGYLVSWCVGHLVELSAPETYDYDERYSKWRLEDLPILPESWLYQVSSGTKKQFGILKELMKRPDVEKLQTKGPGYARWAKVHNLKEMSKSLLFLREHGIDSREDLNALVDKKVAERDVLRDAVQPMEKRITVIAALRKHIYNYSDTRATYEAYRKAGYSKKFFEAHREELTIHKAAKKAFDELGVKKIPRVKELN